MSTIASLLKGEIGYISEESLDFIPLKLLEMGCLPGAEVQLIQLAPLKDPLYICVNGSHLAIRKETASQIKILKAHINV
ncbi:FeoA family protein [Polaribacter sp.]|uniref:FeoA family protein n=1 Tax=Polaribacter sp. TaxID=1920175 RepID=UPI003F6A5C6A